MTTKTVSKTPAPVSLARAAAAVDLNAEGRDAVVLATALAEATGAELMLVTIEPDLALVVPGVPRERMRQETEEMLRRTRNELAPGARMQIDRDLSAARGLHRLVHTHHRDLLVLGSGGHGEPGRVTLGHVTRQLLDDLPCALAIAPRGLHAQQRLELRRIAVGFDGGDESRAALATAAAIAAGAGAQLLVRAVVDDRVPALGWPNVWMGTILNSWEQLMEDEERAIRSEAESALAELAVEAEVQVARARPGVSLMALSGEVDLMVIGSRRWGPLARLVLGGTGERLAHGAHCPLLVVPRPATT